VPVEIRARSLPYDGRTVRVSAIRDISERVEAEERQRHLENDLRHAAEQWRQTFDALDLGIVLVDPEDASSASTAAPWSWPAGRVQGTVDAGCRHRGRRALAHPPRHPRRVALRGRPWSTRRATAPRARSFYLLGSPWFTAEGDPPGASSPSVT
jgi:PAS domain-containing protein